MDDQKTCGQGLAENSELPAKVAELVAAMSGVLETHREALAPRDASSRREDEAYRELAQALRKVGEDLRAVATRMAGYRNLAMTRVRLVHVPEKNRREELMIIYAEEVVEATAVRNATKWLHIGIER